MYVVLGLEMVDQSGLKGLRRQYKRLVRETLQDVAEYYLKEVVPRHFTPGNRSRYPIEPRTKVYMRQIKPKFGEGQGKFVELLFKGQSRRWLAAFARISVNSQRAVVRMRPPGYFTNPKTGTYRDPVTGRMKHIRHQPDKRTELISMSNDDKQGFRDRARKNFGKRIKKLQRESMNQK